MKRRKKRISFFILILRKPWLSFAFLLLVLFIVNFIYQIYQKPTEVISSFYAGQSSDLNGTWKRYKNLFINNSTEHINAKTLASIAQVESAGQWAASPSWQWKITDNWRKVFSPASSALGVMQITKGHQKSVLQHCQTESVKSKLCNNTSWWARLWPSHSINLAAIYIDKTISEIKRNSKSKINDEYLTELAAIAHLCGEQKAKLYAKSGFKFKSFKKCGNHNAVRYVNRVKRLRQRLNRL